MKVIGYKNGKEVTVLHTNNPDGLRKFSEWVDATEYIHPQNKEVNIEVGDLFIHKKEGYKVEVKDIKRGLFGREIITKHCIYLESEFLEDFKQIKEK